MLELVMVDLNNDHESVGKKRENLVLFALLNRNKNINIFFQASVNLSVYSKHDIHTHTKCNSEI